MKSPGRADDLAHLDMAPDLTRVTGEYFVGTTPTPVQVPADPAADGRLEEAVERIATAAHGRRTVRGRRVRLGLRAVSAGHTALHDATPHA